MAKPIVAVVGRPNVGKSTLFNRLAGKRISIVEDTPGVTRDRIYADSDWNGRKFSLIDTGGIEDLRTAEENVILSEMRAQAQIAIDTADVIVLVVDVQVGVTANDSEVAAILHRSRKPVVLACNKVDGVGGVPMQLYEFYNLGLGEPIAVSAVHGKGTGDLLDAVVALLPAEDAGEGDEDEAIKIAVVGKPNAGKSSVINKILGEKRLIVSDQPGTTRDSIDSSVMRDGEEFTLIDTAGMRKRGKIDENIEKYSVMRSLAAIERADVVLMMIDGSEGVTEQDTKIAGFAHDNGKAIVIAVNKWDIIEKDDKTQGEFKRDIRRVLGFMQYAPIIFISAVTGQRVNQIFEMAKYVHEQSGLRVSTGALNEVISDSVMRQQPPSDKGKRLKIYYATQVGVHPPTFVVFVNDSQLMHFSYERYLENQIREVFNFEGTAIKMIIRDKGAD